MTRNRQLGMFAAFIFVFASLFIFTPATNAQVITYVDSVITGPDNDSIVLSIYIDNFSGEEIAGFTLWINLEYADFIGFSTDSIWYESSWIEGGVIDTVGSLISGWGLVLPSMFGTENRVLKIVALASYGSITNPGISSPTSYSLLCRVIAEVKPYEETDSCYVWEGDDQVALPWIECFCDSTMQVTFNSSQSQFSNNSGQLIGLAWNDTAWSCKYVPPNDYLCVRKCASGHCQDSSCYYSYDDSCYVWECTDCEVWDSAAYIDPEVIMFSNGLITVDCPDYVIGDANADGRINVSDAVRIINYVFIGGIPPNPLASGEVNCDGVVNVSDAVMLINYIFIGGKSPGDTDGDGIPDC